MPGKPLKKEIRAKVLKAFKSLPKNHSHSMRTFCVWLVDSGVFPDHKPSSLHKHCTGLFDGKRVLTLTDEEKQVIIERRDQHNAFLDKCEEKGIDPLTVNMVWDKTKDHSIQFYPNRGFNKDWVELFEDVVNRHVSGPPRQFTPHKLKVEKAVKGTLTDEHVGMNPNPNGDGLFQYEYNPDIYRARIEHVYQSFMKEYRTHGTFDLLLLDNLGDLPDGYGGYTTRGGHELPQNMSDAEVFELCVDEKVNLIRNLVESNVANRVKLRSVSNDNHGGSFTQIINVAIKKCIELIYGDFVEVDILTRFIEHRIYGDHCFLMTHGKDKAEMKKGLPYILDLKATKFINEYLDHYQPDAKYFHVEKGDLHQVGYMRTKRFDYRNYMSFAPPSNWVQTNIGDAYSGYSMQVIPKHSRDITHTDYYFEDKKVQ
jgi:hypothetical protein